MARTLEFTLDHHWLRELPIDSADWSTADPNALLDLKNLNIEHSLRRISEEISHPQRDSDSMISALAESIGIDISRTLTCQSKASCTSDIKGTLNKAKLHFIQDFILSYQDGSPNLADVANECGFSVAHLRRIFKNTVGKTLYEFIEEIRMERAQQLLREPTLQLKAIAYRLGYAQPSAFASAFKKAVGESPSDYRSRFESSPPSSNT
jgi:AraC family transcriptional regulator